MRIATTVLVVAATGCSLIVDPAGRSGGAQSSCGDGEKEPYVESCEGSEDDCLSDSCVKCDPAESVLAGGRCYTFRQTEVSWTTARSGCFLQDAELATFPAAVTDDKSVATILDELATKLNQSLPSEMWIGLSQHQDTWYWVGGERGAANVSFYPGYPRANDYRGQLDASGNFISDVNSASKSFLCMRTSASDRFLRDPDTGHHYMRERTSLRTAQGNGRRDEDALPACTERQAQLLEIDSADELQLITSQLGSTEPAFIGLKRMNDDGNWYWDNPDDDRNGLLDETIIPRPAGTGDCAVLEGATVRAETCFATSVDYICEWPGPAL